VRGLRVLLQFGCERNHLSGILVIFPLQPFAGFFLPQLLESPHDARIDIRNVDLCARRHPRTASFNRDHTER
ncbi:MAG: hypothetical protein JWM83_30, partial [Candidatus Angelobacter sp.]|nr:hypothetical protein [Candidatus Angelobacter sp.]